MPSYRTGRGQQALLEGQEGLGVPPGGLGGLRRHFWRAGRGWESLPEDREWSGGPSKGL